MLGWQGAGKILADNLGACLQHSRTGESKESGAGVRALQSSFISRCKSPVLHNAEMCLNLKAAEMSGAETKKWFNDLVEAEAAGVHAHACKFFTSE